MKKIPPYNTVARHRPRGCRPLPTISTPLCDSRPVAARVPAKALPARWPRASSPRPRSPQAASYLPLPSCISLSFHISTPKV
ncbi:MAG: hypothetical protein NC036_08485 [Muribaculaceae bacterium]|nr:hypothetical protein [Muribaculaceae bacterium]